MKVTVYCGANMGNNEIYRNSAIEMGKWIAKNNHHLVYGGGKLGLMGVVSDTVMAEGGEVTGIITHFLTERELANEDITKLIKVDTMPERKKIMMELGDVYIALPGGPGTLEEIVELISWARIGQNNNPCIFFNINNYYEPIKSMYDLMVNSGFLTEDDRNKILFTTSYEEMENFIKTYTPPAIRKYK
ncbi:MAG: TIGR00730 family Rossman fold protein [Fusobacterium sp.]|uniref:LOG family protein n=1 Tax=Fusobacterium sp. TaxID=68766 RepID=UPI0026DD501D|nr:TIGR00730 family Rossman fold protein [Fusobacterium sp.]MDO4690716.1 TIGR00730 family Rossman fold protein [Fusobacterium sp.]